MEWAKLAVEVVKALAWPIVVTVLVAAFRRPIAVALSSVTRVKLPGGVEIEFRSLGNAVTDTGLQIKQEIVKLARLVFGPKEASYERALHLLARLKEKEILSLDLARALDEFVRASGRRFSSTGIGVEELAALLGRGASLLGLLRHTHNVQRAVHELEGGVHHIPRGERRKYYFWSIIAATVPQFDYDYEALREAVIMLGGREEQLAREAQRTADRLELPRLSEFLQILGFRRKELLRVKALGYGDAWRQSREWQWPGEWGDIDWNQPIVDEPGQEEEEILRTEAAIERYQLFQP